MNHWFLACKFGSISNQETNGGIDALIALLSFRPTSF